MASRPWLILVLLYVAAAALGDTPGFDAARLRTGTFTYRDTLDGKPGALSTSTITRLPNGNYRFSADIPAFDQSWETTATGSMGPLATTLKMRTREGRHYVMTLKYAGSKVSGEAVTSPSADERLPGQDLAVTGEVGPGTVDQRIDWATVMTTDKVPGESFEFQVYDAKSGSSRVHCVVSDAGMMESPEGKVRAIRLTYTVYKAGGTEVYIVYANATFPRMMLREDLRGSLVINLVKAAP